jgi:hypothetical protein
MTGVAIIGSASAGVNTATASQYSVTITRNQTSAESLDDVMQDYSFVYDAANNTSTLEFTSFGVEDRDYVAGPQMYMWAVGDDGRDFELDSPTYSGGSKSRDIFTADLTSELTTPSPTQSPPSLPPSVPPSGAPSTVPTGTPSQRPSVTAPLPNSLPTDAPTSSPTIPPSTAPTSAPTSAPTNTPTGTPTVGLATNSPVDTGANATLVPTADPTTTPGTEPLVFSKEVHDGMTV